jgi:hypothetical protein
MRLKQNIETAVAQEMSAAELNASPFSLEMSREEFYLIRRMVGDGLDALQDRIAKIQRLAEELKGLDKDEAEEVIAAADWLDVDSPEEVAEKLEDQQALLEQAEEVKGELARIAEEGDLALLL